MVCLKAAEPPYSFIVFDQFLYRPVLFGPTTIESFFKYSFYALVDADGMKSTGRSLAIRNATCACDKIPFRICRVGEHCPVNSPNHSPEAEINGLFILRQRIAVCVSYQFTLVCFRPNATA